ncbi:MAG: DinB family protein [Armatimonadota bacterium]
MSLPAPACLYLATSLDNTPATLAALLSHLPAGDIAWETRPDPDRFSLREIVAHLADWEAVWRERFERILNEEKPLLLRPDISQRSEEKGYADADPQECLTRFAEGRSTLTAWLRALPPDAWGRLATLDRMGEMPLEALASLALGHDSYHLRQVTEWRAADQ